MAYQQYITATEHDDFLRDTILLRRTLLLQKVTAIKEGVFIPDSLIAELEMFASRNMLSNEIDSKYLTSVPREVCPHCLKAHALHHAGLLGLPTESLEFIASMLPGNIGHNGYYLDNGKVVKVEEDD